MSAGARFGAGSQSNSHRLNVELIKVPNTQSVLDKLFSTNKLLDKERQNSNWVISNRELTLTVGDKASRESLIQNQEALKSDMQFTSTIISQGSDQIKTLRQSQQAIPRIRFQR